MKKFISFLCAIFLLTWVTFAYAKLEFNPVTGRLDKTSQPGSVVSFDPSDYGGVNWGDADALTPFTWGWNSGSVQPSIAFGNGTMDFYNTAVTIHGTNSSFVFANNMYFNGDTARKLLLGSTGGTFNENLRIDNDTTTNTIGIDSTTGVTNIDFGTIGLRNTATNNSMGSVSIGTAGTPASTVSAAGNVSVGAAYAVAHAAPSNGAVIQGNVGIGTWLPTTALQVNGTITASAITLSSTTQGSSDYYEASANGSNKVTVTAPASLTGDRSCTLEDDSTPFDNCVSASGGGGGWTDGGSNMYQTDTTDTVGIGTTTGTGKLDVRGDEVRVWTGAGTDTNATSSGELYVEGDAEVDGTMYASSASINGSLACTADGSNCPAAAGSGWLDGGTNVYVSTTTDNVGIGTVTPSATLLVENAVSTIDSFRVNDSVGDATPFVITSAGNVGIGTSVPTSLFMFASSAPTTNFITMSTASAPAMAIRADAATSTDLLNLQGLALITGNVLDASSSSTAFTVPMVTFTSSGATMSQPTLNVTQGGNGLVMKINDVSGDTSPLVVNSEGNVGIGTVDPRATLHITNQATNPIFAISSVATGTAGDYVIVTSTGNVGIGTATAPTNKLVFGFAAGSAGKANCTTTNGAQGVCSSAVDSGGGCTCTAF